MKSLYVCSSKSVESENPCHALLDNDAYNNTVVVA
jgi:hypothetical protein